MNPKEKQALLTIVIMAALADGTKADAERAELRRVAAVLAGEGDVNMPAALQDVLLKRTSLSGAAAALPNAEHRQLAFELAVGVCDADGLRNDAETRFLAELGEALGLTPPQMAEPAAVADALATAPVASVADVSGEELDKLILNAAILNGALELLPQSMASLAIIPLQMRMVYRIGKHHGYELDRDHIKDLLAAVGVGLTGQYLEDIGRKLIGGLFGAVAGGIAGALARGATGAAFSFATTWALGQVARRYYAGGRTMSADLLKESFAAMLAEARGLQGRYAQQIETQARRIDLNKIVQMVRSS